MAKRRRRGHKDFPGTYDSNGSCEKRTPGEILGPWKNSQNSILWDLHGEEHFPKYSVKFSSFDGSLDLPCNHPRYDPLYKVRPFIEMMERSFLRSYRCGWDLSFDEGSMAWKGRVNFKYYNPVKPAKWHLKLFEVSDAKKGFVIGFEVYTGKITTQCAVNAQVLDPDCNQTTRVVIGLLDKARLLDKEHHVYMDNYYSNPLEYINETEKL